MDEPLDDLLAEAAPEEAACPRCGERSVDRLTINDDNSVVCAGCGNHYGLPGTVRRAVEDALAEHVRLYHGREEGRP